MKLEAPRWPIPTEARAFDGCLEGSHHSSLSGGMRSGSLELAMKRMPRVAFGVTKMLRRVRRLLAHSLSWAGLVRRIRSWVTPDAPMLFVTKTAVCSNGRRPR